jgi:hypothetical protein
MAAQSFFETKVRRETSGGDTGAAAEMDHSKMSHGVAAGAKTSEFSLPYEFPTAGDYRIWVQVKTAGTVRTAEFAALVADEAK